MTPAEDIAHAACSVSTIFVDVATSMDDVGVSRIRSSGGCMPYVVRTCILLLLLCAIGSSQPDLDVSFGCSEGNNNT
nr:hypothetical protein [Tanacetum cinerariifolium]